MSGPEQTSVQSVEFSKDEQGMYRNLPAIALERSKIDATLADKPLPEKPEEKDADSGFHIES